MERSSLGLASGANRPGHKDTNSEKLLADSPQPTKSNDQNSRCKRLANFRSHKLHS